MQFFSVLHLVVEACLPAYLVRGGSSLVSITTLKTDQPTNNFCISCKPAPHIHRSSSSLPHTDRLFPHIDKSSRVVTSHTSNTSLRALLCWHTQRGWERERERERHSTDSNLISALLWPKKQVIVSETLKWVVSLSEVYTERVDISECSWSREVRRPSRSLNVTR